ncbi:hypothetical protein STA1M1_12650 [Sinisalibacter aestuarii]|uniref:WYL domain-containing protein n=2 Tax=Sinisalibacter aestuarii TaxID=2949426 RepID=A0ABQ5LSU8_9RHOB|nr:hypothetical protein STA1M1_12650 [Sinisalibacter aestuarii]
MTWRGVANRRDLMDRFNISNAQAAIDFRVYLDRSPTPPVYDTREKRYVSAPGHASLATSALSEVFEIIDTHVDAVPALLPQPDRQTDPRIISLLYQGMMERAALNIRYTSMSTGATDDQWIAPTQFTNDGESIHLRAWSFRHKAYRDYLPIRIEVDSSFQRRALEGPLPRDEDWLTLARIWLRPHSELSNDQAEAVRREFGFGGPLLLLETRKAMEFYFDRRWRIGAPGTRLERARTEYVPITTETVENA